MVLLVGFNIDQKHVLSLTFKTKLLISRNSAGSLIGKHGSFIKQIKDDTGAHVQISPKLDELAERVVIIEGYYQVPILSLTCVTSRFSLYFPHSPKMSDSFAIL